MAEEYNGADLRDLGAKWMDRIRAAEKREENWLKDAEAAEAAYTSDRNSNYGSVPEFNILHSNVETIVPSVYNSTPVPDIREKWPAPQPVAPQPPPGMMPPPPMPQGMPPGMGGMRPGMPGMAPQMPRPPMAMPAPPPDTTNKDVAELLERAITVQIDDNALDTEMEAAAQDGFLAGRGLVRVKLDADVETFTEIRQSIGPDGMVVEEEFEGQTVSNERVRYEAVPWRDYREGPAKRFDAVPWVAFRHIVADDEIKGRFDVAMIDAQSLDDEPQDGEQPAERTVWEIWCKTKREVLFVRESDGVILQRSDDPLGLKGFFPIPEPIQPIKVTGKRVPFSPYEVYRKQAEELDSVTKRIKAITSGLKVRGGVAGDMENIKAVAEAGDNELVAIENVEGLAVTGGLDKAIIWWPVDKAIQVLRELYIARDQIKQLIYEITGISDIIRGASNANETATAQQIKTQWGSVRIKKMQRLVERHVRDLFVLTSEVIANNFTIQTLKEVTGMDVTAEMVAVLEGGLKQHRIDIESDSTVRADLSRARGEMEGFLRGTAEFFGAMAPVVQQAPQMAEPITGLYSTFARQFNLGKQAEDAIDQMGKIAKGAGSGGRPDPRAAEAKAEAQAKQAEIQSKGEEAKARMQLEGQKAQADMQSRQAEMQMKAQEVQSRAQLEMAKQELAQAEAQANAQEAMARIELDRQRLELEREKVFAEIALKAREVAIKEAGARVAAEQQE